MLSFLPKPVLGLITFLLIVANTVILCIPLFLVTFLKLLVPFEGWRKGCSWTLALISELWSGVNNGILVLTQKIDWDVQCAEGLNRHGWYLVTCNHQSWVDIVVLQYVLNRKIPSLKFFLKQELIWVPILGVAWWALDFPFMKRHSKDYLERHPEKKGKDLATTRKACEKYRGMPVSVMNFMEGTRFTPEKSARQASPYRHLLKPKSGGVAFVLAAMGGQLHALLDVTIVYHDEPHNLKDLLCGRLRKITVRMQEREIPEEMSQGNYDEDPVFRKKFQSWVNGIWSEKDQLIESIKAE